MNRKLLLTLVTAGVATAVIASRRREGGLFASRTGAAGRVDRQGRAGTWSSTGGQRYDASEDALGLVLTVDELEIAAAEHALGRDLDPTVREYAQVLLNDHTENLAATQALGADVVATDEVTQLRGEHERRMRELDRLDDEAYAAAFLDAMTEGHARTLDLLDELRPDVQDEEVRDHLSQTRARIAQHLQLGQQLLEGRNA